MGILWSIFRSSPLWAVLQNRILIWLDSGNWCTILDGMIIASLFGGHKNTDPSSHCICLPSEETMWSFHLFHVIPFNHFHVFLSPAICFFMHDGVIKLKHFPRYWPFVRGINRSPVNSLHKGQWHRDLIFSLISINAWVNNREAGDREKPLRSLWHHCNGCSIVCVVMYFVHVCLILYDFIDNKDFPSCILSTYKHRVYLAIFDFIF